MFHYHSVLALSALSLWQTSWGATDADWRSRSIYQVMTDRFARTDGSLTARCRTDDQTYCGGTYKGIENNLDYIQGMGFDAVWVSPITRQMQDDTVYGDSYHGYWQTDLYNLNENFGTAEDLKSLSLALHKRQMYLMVDIVVNHVAWNGSVSSVNYTSFNPFNSEKDFHQYCGVDYYNETSVTDCWMGDSIVPLPDIRTEDPAIASTYATWIGDLVAEYSIDGLRLDTVRQVDTSFWSGFHQAANVYMVGEIYDDNATYMCGFQEHVPGVFNYATYFQLIDAFTSSSGNMSALSGTMASTADNCKDLSLLGTFSENHDQPRFASINGDISVAANVLAFTMLTDGIPVIYQGQEQHYDGRGGGNVPFNREAIWYSGYKTNVTLYNLVTILNKVRKAAILDDLLYLTTQTQVLATDNHTISLKKGIMTVVLTNEGSSAASYDKLVPTNYTPNTTLIEMLTCNTTVSDSSGRMNVTMEGGQPRVFLPAAVVEVGVCKGAIN
ncbi:glycoside hydrolase family 13 protein [Polychaeton citri CBS 116435]|uniref:alpha-amylase n=1 Tax=Polychaeton citri CBS 116435 TaxID=1314669 RepID=A0A9P4QAS7_9PEZI|nr:glycoside hydrolase family 13 protein [Polychaeton citri CBS 116435]